MYKHFLNTQMAGIALTTLCKKFQKLSIVPAFQKEIKMILYK